MRNDRCHCALIGLKFSYEFAQRRKQSAAKKRDALLFKLRYEILTTFKQNMNQ